MLTPSVYRPDVLVESAKQHDHPRYGEYVEYAKRRRHPMTFWDWLKAAQRQSRDLRSVLQKQIDEPGCVNPLSNRTSKAIVKRAPHRTLWE